jgi:hypothetical protein
MRVAMFAVSLLGIASVQVGHAQVVSVEGATFNGAVPATAIHNPSVMVPEFAMPAVRQAALVRSVSTRRTAASAGSVLRLPATRFAYTHFTATRPAMGAPSARVGSGSNIAMPTRALQVRQPPVRSFTDHLLASVVGLMLIAYQLRRKHRVLRPHPFAI